MMSRIVISYFLIFMIFYSSIQSSPLFDDYITENGSPVDFATPTFDLSSFISFICQRQEQYPFKLKRKVCSKYVQSFKIQEEKPEQQRNKRVGWTISV